MAVFFFPGNNGKFEGVANVMSEDDHGNVSDGKWFSLLLLLLLLLLLVFELACKIKNKARMTRH